MKKLMLTLAVAAMLTGATGCKKSKCESVYCGVGSRCDENTGQCIYIQTLSDCQINNTATLTIVNNMPDAYTVSVTGFPSYTFNSGDSYTYPPFTPQTINIRATQQNYTTLPRISHTSHTFAQCDNLTWTF